MRKTTILSFLIIMIGLHVSGQDIWSKEKANEWYKKQGWLVGCNYIPHTAINELEMWQADTWDPATIDKELGWAEGLGMNTLRVFLHDLLWQQDSQGFLKRLNEFLAICEKHHIRPMLVLFDSVWDPNPQLGKQRDPVPGVHNSGWVQSPGLAAMGDETQYPRLETYVKGVVGALANDPRVLCWDVWNEPDNINAGRDPNADAKMAQLQKLLPAAFGWARSAKPSQPLTCGVWKINLDNFTGYNTIEKIQLEQSDVISFHNYGDAASFNKSIALLKSYERPMFCTEYLARGFKSTFESILPLGKQNKVAMINWGFVKGKTQTHLPWDSWEKPYINGREPAVWHHEIYYPDGKPYSEQEVKLFKKLTGHR